MSSIYIHFGADKFDPKQFRPIQNVPLHSKPQGGLWGSPLSSEDGWAAWCIREGQPERLEQAFAFRLTPAAEVFHIYNAADITKLPQQRMGQGDPVLDMIFGAVGLHAIDFEKCARMGLDAIELHMSSGNTAELRHHLSGWDCDSVVVLSPKVVIPENVPVSISASTTAAAIPASVTSPFGGDDSEWI